MTLAATLALAWAVLHAYAGTFHAFLFLRRPAREYLSYALFSLGLSLICFAAADLIDASSFAEGAAALSLSFVGRAIALSAIVAFTFRFLGQPDHWSVRVAIGWGTAGGISSLAGLFFDPAIAPLTPAGAYYSPTLLPAGVVWLVCGLLLLTYTVLALGRAARRDRSLRLFATFGGVAVIAAWYDGLVLIFQLPLPFVVEHGSGPVTFALSQLIAHRFVSQRAELERRTDQLRGSYQKLQKVQEELVRREQLATVGELSAVVANEVHNPLSALSHAVAGLRDPDLVPPARDELLDSLDAEGTRLDHLVRDLVTYARPVHPQRRAIEVEELVAIALAKASPKGVPKGVTLVTDFVEGTMRVDVDPDLLPRALGNIIANGIEAIASGGTLTIRTRCTELDVDEAVELQVQVEGVGMDMNTGQESRDSFFTTRGSGAVIGVAVVDRVIAAHGGTLDIESRPGHGTKVSIRLATAKDDG